MRIKKAMVLAAGLGTRLGNLTSDKPKALVEIAGIPMLHRLLKKLKDEGVEHVCINIHHYADQIKNSIQANKGFGLKICFSDETELLLHTGGALVAAREFFTGEDPILVHNADILTDLNLHSIARFHIQSQAQATLFVSNRGSSRALLFDKKKQLKGWTNHTTKEFKWVGSQVSEFTTLSFNGVWLTNPHFIQQIPFTGKFSIIDAWLSMASKYTIVGFEDDCAWFDMGTPEKIATAEHFITQIK